MKKIDQAVDKYLDKQDEKYKGKIKEELESCLQEDVSFEDMMVAYGIAQKVKILKIQENDAKEYQEFIESYPKKVKTGLALIIIFPLTFFILLFSTDMKLIFMVCWIVSIILTATYLIWLEYHKYKLENRYMGESI